MRNSYLIIKLHKLISAEQISFNFYQPGKM